ncbi:MAG: hypothetical protein ABIG93_00740 [archaeon]
MGVEQYLDSTALRIKPGVSVIINTNVSVDCKNDAKIKSRIYSPKFPEEDLIYNECSLRSMVKKGELCLERGRTEKGVCDFRYSLKCPKNPLGGYKSNEIIYVKKELRHLNAKKNFLKKYKYNVKELNELIKRKEKLLHNLERKELNK